MSIASMRVIQGEGASFTVTLASSTFQGTETLTAVVNTGGTATALLTVAPTWKAGQTAGSYGLVTLAFTSAQTLALPPDFYVVTISLADATSALSFGLLEVISAAGASPTQDWLVTPARVLGLVPDLAADATNLADLPAVIGAVSDSIRRYCNRWFTRRTVTKEFQVVQGIVQLDEIPVNAVTRVGTDRNEVMTVAGNPSAFQLARITVTTTGDYATGQTVTGVTLTSTASAVTTTTNLLFSTYTTLASLAAAINAVSGWTATVSSGYAAWPTAELTGLTSGQGVLAGGAGLMAYTADAAMQRLDPALGFLYLSPTAGTSTLNSPAWGPDWAVWQGQAPRYPATVKVTYDAGFATVPDAVAMAAVETIQDVFNRLATNQIVKQSTIGDYSFTLRDTHGFMPSGAQASLAPYRIYNA